MTLQELTEKRAKAVADCRTIVDKADAEKRSRTAEEQQSYDRAWQDAEEAGKQIKELETDNQRRSALATAEAEMRSSAGRRVAPTQPTTESRSSDQVIEVEFRGKKVAYKPGSPEYTRSSPQHQAYFADWLRDPKATEQRAANAMANDILADGGYLHPPIQFNAMLIKVIDNLTFVRKLAKVLPVTTSDTLGTPTMPVLYNAATWTTELSQITPDTSAQFGRRDLKPNLLAKAVLVSQKLLKTAAISPESIVTDEMGRIFAYAEENGYLNGSGVNQPLGMFTASANGVSTNRDVVCGNSATTPNPITFDGLQAMKFSLKAQYRNGASWIFHRTILSLIATLKDLQGRYIWEPSVQVGTPDVLLSYPVYESEFAPNAVTSGSYVGMFCNMNYYWIADLVTGFETQRLNELFALTSQIGFIGRRYLDGQPVLEDPFVRGKLS